MSSKITHLFELLSTHWPYALGTVFALAFISWKAFSVLQEQWGFFLLKWKLKRLDVIQLRVEFARAEVDAKEKWQFKKTDESVRDNAVNRNRRLVKMSIVNFCVGFVVLIVWLFGR
jgi:hypothetical protein